MNPAARLTIKSRKIMELEEIYRLLELERDIRDDLIRAYRSLAEEYTPIIFDLSDKIISMGNELTRLRHILGE